jgi:hypothetical protein
MMEGGHLAHLWSSILRDINAARYNKKKVSSTPGGRQPTKHVSIMGRPVWSSCITTVQAASRQYSQYVICSARPTTNLIPQLSIV